MESKTNQACLNKEKVIISLCRKKEIKKEEDEAFFAKALDSDVRVFKAGAQNEYKYNVYIHGCGAVKGFGLNDPTRK